MRPLVFTLFLLALFPSYSCAKKYDLDSLKLVLHRQTAPMERMKTSFWICSIYNHPETNNDDSLRVYSKAALDLAASLDSLQQLATFTSFYGVSHFYSDTAKFFALNQEAEELHMRSKNRVKEIKAAFMAQNLSLQHNEFGQVEKAIAAAKRGLGYLENFDDGDSSLYILNHNLAKSKLLRQLVISYQNMGDYEQSISTLIELEAFLKSAKNFSGLLDAYILYRDVYNSIIGQNNMLLGPKELAHYKSKLLENIDKAYQLSDSLSIRFGRKGVPAFLYGLYYESENDLEKAEQYFQEAISRSTGDQFRNTVLKSSIALAKVYVKQKRPAAAFTMLQKSDSLAQIVKSPILFLELHEIYAKYYLAQRQPQKAQKYLDAASPYLNDHPNIDEQADHYALKHQVALLNKEPQKALEYYKKHIALKDSIANQNLMANFEILQAKYKASQKDIEIGQLQEEKLNQQLIFQRILAAGVLLILIILFISVVVYLRNRNKFLQALQKSSELKHRLLRSQMNPHFTFNALGAIQNYLLVSDQPNKAAYFLAKFAKLMRQILDQSIVSLISVEEEVETLENYLTIQKLRYDSKFDFEINVSKNICTEKTKIPPVLIQPLLENAIEHGMIHKRDDGIVTVDMDEKEGFINVKVKDNGVGLHSSKKRKSNKGYTSVSTSIIEERMNILRTEYGKQIKYQAAELEQGGTESLLVLPKIIQ